MIVSMAASYHFKSLCCYNKHSTSILSNMSEPITFFHVGYARAASTFLQKAVFPALRGIQYIPRNRFRVREREKKRFNADKILMSREAGLRIYSRCDEAFKVFGSRIVISLRRHDSLIASNYRLHIKRGHSTRFKHYLDLESDQGVWKIGQLEYMRLIRHVEKITEQKPIVLIFEDYIENPQAYIESLCKALQCSIDHQALSNKPVHKSYSDKQLRLRRQFADRFANNDFNQKSPGSSGAKHNKLIAFLKRRSLLWVSAWFMFFVKFAPDTWISDEPLIEQAELDKVRDFFQDDWQACVDFVAKQNNSLA